MRKYRVVISAARKHTRHLRASNIDHAQEQALLIAETVEPSPLAVLFGGPAYNIEIVEMGRVSCRTPTD